MEKISPGRKRLNLEEELGRLAAALGTLGAGVAVCNLLARVRDTVRDTDPARHGPPCRGRVALQHLDVRR